ncbi:MAG: BrnT family toxin [Spirochaetaceae bacterium]|jgi:uncharacterized DUF497 family protein|nr:BrnT family toxin [Spirochaetaceae bacterium]
MDIVWDEAKNRLLKRTRGVSFELAAQVIRNHREIAILENPVRPGQIYYIMPFNDYIHVVPALINEAEQIVLKTIFPSRKYQKVYGGNHVERG